MIDNAQLNDKILQDVVLSLVDSKYSRKNDISHLINSDTLIFNAIKYAKRNGLLYAFNHKLAKEGLEIDFSKNGDDCAEEINRLKNFKDTISFLNIILEENNVDFIVIKIFNTVHHVPNDIDIFINKNQRRKVISLLESKGMRLLHSGPTETKLSGQYLKTDIYTGIDYIGFDFIDRDYIFKSKINTRFFGLNYPALNDNADFLMLIPHYLLGHRRITLLDFLHMKSRMETINIKECRKYAYDRGWGILFDSTIDRLNLINEELYSRKKYVKFPYIFERNFLMKCIENLEGLNIDVKKRLFLHASFFQEDVIYNSEDKAYYNLVRSCLPLRNAINSASANLKRLRGDKKSLSED